MIGIYKITNLVNGKVYIGQSVDIESRFRKHHTAPFNEKSSQYKSHLYAAIRKYSLDNFRFEIIEECLQSELNNREEYWVAFYQSYTNPQKGYNETKGGSGTKGCGVKLDEESAQEIQELLLTTTLAQEDIANYYNISQKLVSNINSGNSWHNDMLPYPLRRGHGGQHIKQQHFCIDCGMPISAGATRCSKCYALTTRKVDRPAREELKQLIRTKSFLEIGRQFGVSDNAIRKWCDIEKLPRSKKEIKSYSDEQWALI